MKTSDGYRFNLQFKNLSDAQRQVGDFLEWQGNKKSEIIVTAMVEFLQAHPELLNADNPVKVITTYGFSEETLNQRIEAMVRKVAGQITATPEKIEAAISSKITKDNALDILMDGLEMFE